MIYATITFVNIPELQSFFVLKEALTMLLFDQLLAILTSHYSNFRSS